MSRISWQPAELLRIQKFMVSLKFLEKKNYLQTSVSNFKNNKWTNSKISRVEDSCSLAEPGI